jgi:hypothetical protein
MLTLTEIQCGDGKIMMAVICPVCNEMLYCSGWRLDDCFGCAFVCPKCGTYMFLDPQKN